MSKESLDITFMGQAGYLFHSGDLRVGIDLYLSDSAGVADPRFTRLFPPPILPYALHLDVYIVTHNHLDHLDPETIQHYPGKQDTLFIAPRLAAKRLMELGVPSFNIRVVDHGDSLSLPGVDVHGVFALGTTQETLDTSGYHLIFDRGISVYHSSDTSMCKMLLDNAPKADVLLVCINGKFGNLNVHEAIELTHAVAPRYVFPNHYDMMALNSENPETFRYLMDSEVIDAECVILKAGETVTLDVREKAGPL